MTAEAISGERVKWASYLAGLTVPVPLVMHVRRGQTLAIESAAQSNNLMLLKQESS